MEVEVIGGGPAGLRVSRLLSEGGHDVTLYERGEIGSNISCGEAHLDIYPDIEKPQEGLIGEHERVYHVTDGKKFPMDGHHIYQYDKESMEKGMKERALSSSVEIRENSRKTDPSDEYLTVDASGFPSILYPSDDYAKAFAVSCTVDGKTDEMVFDWKEDGYFWAFPKRTATNAGFGTFSPPFDGVKEKAVSYSREMGEIRKVSGGFIPLSLDKPLWDRNTQTILVGDAAGLANSFHGGGIHTALLSARILVDSVDDLDSYEPALSDRMRDERRMAEVATEFCEKGKLGELLQFLQPSDNIRELTRPSLFRKIRVGFKKALV